MEALWEKMSEYHDQKPTPCKYNNMKLSMFINPEKPRAKMAKLKGRGAEVKALIPALLSVWKQYYMVDGVQQHEEIALALESSARVDEILDDHKTDYKLPGPVAAEFETHIWIFLIMQNSLAMHFSGLGDMLFDIIPKSHYLAHIGLFAKYLNPRLGWCYAGEDFMHTVQTIGATAAIGNRPVKCGSKLFQKYSAGLSCDMMRFERSM